MARTTIRSEDITAGQIKSADLETNVVIDGDLTVDTDTLYVDSTNNRVGIGTTSPAARLEVIGGLIRANRGGGDSDTSYGALQFAVDGVQHAMIASENSYTLKFITNNSERMRINSSGNVLVGTTGTVTTGSEGVEIRGDYGYIKTARNNTGNVGHILFYNPNGNVGSINTNGSATAYNTSSDYRLKEDWQPMSGSIDRVKALNPVNFAWKADGSRVDGFLAHEAQEVVSEAVTGVKDAMRTEEYEVTPAVFNDEGVETTAAVMGTREVPEYQGIDQSKLVPLLTSALQEAVAKIESLEARVAVLEAN